MSECVYIEDMEVGMERSRSKLVTAAEIEAFGFASGDRNPVHFDEDYASQTMFGGVIAHGMLTAGLISAVLGTELPGRGTIYLGQTLAFKGPVRPGDEVVATCRVREVAHEKRRVILDCICAVGQRVVLLGEATVLAPSRAEASRAA